MKTSSLLMSSFTVLSVQLGPRFSLGPEGTDPAVASPPNFSWPFFLFPGLRPILFFHFLEAQIEKCVSDT